MEYFSIDTLVAILGLFIGGGGGAFFTWRWQRRKAAAEAKKEELDYYKQVIQDISADRDYYKQERDEYRKTIKHYDERMDYLDRNQARLGRMVEAMRPFMCADLACKLRKRVVVSEEGEIKEDDPRKRRQPKKASAPVPPGITSADIEPIEHSAL